MQRNRLSASSQLRFESNLETQVQRSNQRPLRLGRALGVLAVLILIVALAAWMTHFVRGPSHAAADDPYAVAVMTIINALRSGNIAEAITVTSEGEPGRTQLREDAQQRFKAVQADPPPRRPTLLEFLTTLRADMAQQGLAWDQIRPLAFGGVRANILDTQKMKDPAVSVTGEVYFTAGDAVYALELTGRVCKASVVITDFWKCAPITAKPDDLRTYASDRYYAFKHETFSPNERAKIRKPRQLFFLLTDTAPQPAAGK